jgi:hypothetical protein
MPSPKFTDYDSDIDVLKHKGCKVAESEKAKYIRQYMRNNAEKYNAKRNAKSQLNLVNHVFRCDVCDKNLSSKQALDFHMKSKYHAKRVENKIAANTSITTPTTTQQQS